MKHPKKTLSQQGSSLFIILIAVALFAALSYAMSQRGDSGAALSSERIRLSASDIIDMGNKLSDSVVRLRLRNISQTQISFENTIVAGYTNPDCTTDACKIFAFDGGGRDWETPTTDINGGRDWGFTSNLAIRNIGTAAADLIAVLPGLSLAVCNRINTMIGLYDISGSPSVFAAVTANKFIGSYAVPVTLTDLQINGQKSACIRVTTASGTAISGAPLSNTYIFYQILEAR